MMTRRLSAVAVRCDCLDLHCYLICIASSIADLIGFSFIVI